jgi:hypothetical protein
MFKLLLDMSLVFEPPIKHVEPGIRLTRIFELPFAPIEGMYLTGDALNDLPRPEGFKLQTLPGTWTAAPSSPMPT